MEKKCSPKSANTHKLPIPHSYENSRASNLKSLTSLKKELQSNTQLVGSNLSGGAHGHLGLVLTPAKYQTISATPYEFSPLLGPFTLHQNTDAAEVVRCNNAHMEKIRMYWEVNDIKKALIRQIVAVVNK